MAEHAQRRDRRRRRRRRSPAAAAALLLPLLPAAAAAGVERDGGSAPLLRSRAHHAVVRPPTLPSAAAAGGEDDAAAAGREVDGEGGIVTRDSHGLLVEVASPESEPASDREQERQPQQQQQATTRIIDGTPRLRSDHPYVVRLHFAYPGRDPDLRPHRTFYCGGSLISPDVVLTAAHCLVDGMDSHADVYDALSGETRTYRTIGSKMHPAYDEGGYRYDYGLVVLEAPHLAVAVAGGGGGGGGGALGPPTRVRLVLGLAPAREAAPRPRRPDSRGMRVAGTGEIPRRRLGHDRGGVRRDVLLARRRSVPPER
jgi:hypothetical protein